MYHDVLPPGTADPTRLGESEIDVYTMSWSAFVSHLDALERAARDRSAGWTLTFDDAGSGSLEVARALAARCIEAYFFAATALVGRPRFATADDLRAIQALGHIVGSHSHTHPERLSALSPDAITREWATSVSLLGEMLGRPVTTASVPGGYSSDAVVAAAASAGVRRLFTSQPTTRAHESHGCLVRGRYAIRRDTTAEVAVALATGHGTARARQAAAWKARGVAKAVLGGTYPAVRRAVLRRLR